MTSGTGTGKTISKKSLFNRKKITYNNQINYLDLYVNCFSNLVQRTKNLKRVPRGKGKVKNFLHLPSVWL